MIQSKLDEIKVLTIDDGLLNIHNL